MLQASEALQKACEQIIRDTGAHRCDASTLVNAWFDKLACDANNVKQVYTLVRRITTEIQPFLLNELHTWVLALDSWLDAYFPLQSSCEYTSDAEEELHLLADDFAAVWTRHILHNICNSVETQCRVNCSSTTTHQTSETLNSPELTLAELQSSKVLDPNTFIEQQLQIQEKAVSYSVKTTLQRQVGLVDDLLLLVDENVDLQTRFEMMCDNPRLVQTAYEFLSNPPQTFISYCADKNDVKQWLLGFAMCTLGEIAGIARLRGAAIAATNAQGVKRMLFGDWASRHQSSITRVCTYFRNDIHNRIMSCTSLVEEFNVWPSTTADMMESIPSLTLSTSFQFKGPTSASTMISPEGVSIRRLRLLAFIKETSHFKTVDHIDLDIVQHLLRRMHLEHKCSNTPLPMSILDSTSSSLVTNTEDTTNTTNTTNTLTNDGRRIKSLNATKGNELFLFLNAMQQIAGKRSNPTDTPQTKTLTYPTYIILFDDIATTMKWTVNMSTSQKLAKFMDRMMRYLQDEIANGHVQYIKAVDFRKKSGSGRSGRKTRNHLIASEVGIYRCREVSKRLMNEYESDRESFLQKWSK